MAENPKECGARRRGTDQRCRAPAMPNGRCRIHGGASPGRPLVHGRYSVAHRNALAEKQAAFLADPRPADLSEELALTRALLADYLERFDDGGPLRAEDIGHLLGLIGSIGSQVERIHRIRNANAITAAEVRYFTARLVDLIGKYLPDPERRAQFMAELRAAIEPPGRGPWVDGYATEA